MAFSQLLILVNAGGNNTANVTIAIPPAAATDPFATDPGKTSAQLQPGVAGIVEAIRKLGFWDSQGLNYYPPAAILKVMPQ